ncbi:Diguanylate cyclase OS=Desulfuromonas acetoxidans DSM 684 GN=Dace_1778 PE=4 SV=1: HDOD [Gemmataceae bacterium]|nr:Diguanylate cyclase OS=Desulfuromonas acetoxidans DSM 684 GN=Dace_1778 PE=4 SV=1: HDOD [Gemmataceae bacterium]VTT97885.1 Diguanylate cyclase OS=Desulfuromonas acetoxidans DSM 684 GN=Dace_1778 PE=4 SV=1: HDOD [Gemmataceae bacterium]
MAKRLTGWITRSATTRPVPTPRLPTSREAILEAVLHPASLPTHPAIAVKVVEVASRPDCRPHEIVALLNQDPGLCAELLRAVNASNNGLARPVGSVDRAVLVVGLNRVRSLALGLSLPAMRSQSRTDPAALEHSLESVGGAIFARELAERLGHPNPNEDLIAGLLRDVGILLLQQTFPKEWADFAKLARDPLREDQCAREREFFGADHADIGAEALRKWGLPEGVHEAIRHHHAPGNLAGTAFARRAELLWFAGLLTRLEAVVEYPAALDRVLAVAADRFSLPTGRLADFLEEVRPKVDQFAGVIDRDIGRCPDFASLVLHGTAELARLAASPPEFVREPGAGPGGPHRLPD